MKATELMIDDWVFNTHNNKPEQVQEVLTGNDIDYAVMLDYRDIYNEDDIEPIPLTTEILEKNGLEKRCSDELVLFDNSKIDTTGEYIIIRYFVNTQRVWLCKGIGVDENEIRINCQYVHELQHALRLANINKEIVL